MGKCFSVLSQGKNCSWPSCDIKQRCSSKNTLVVCILHAQMPCKPTTAFSTLLHACAHLNVSTLDMISPHTHTHTHTHCIFLSLHALMGELSYTPCLVSSHPHPKPQNCTTFNQSDTHYQFSKPVKKQLDSLYAYAHAIKPGHIANHFNTDSLKGDTKVSPD